MTGAMKPGDEASLEAQARFYGSELARAGATGKYGAPAVAYNKARLNQVLDQMKLSPEERAYHQFNIQNAEQGKPVLTRDEYKAHRENAPVIFKELVDATAPYAKEAKGATDVRTQLGLMRAITKNKNFISGEPGSSIVMRFATMASSLKSSLLAMGVPVENINIDRLTGPAALMESFNALSNSAVMASLGGSLGNQVSNSDRLFIESAFPNLRMTKEGNQLLIEMLDKLSERKIRLGNMAAAYREEHKTRGTGTASDMQTRIQKYIDTNHLLADESGKLTDLGQRINKLGGGESGPPPPAPQAAPTQRGPISGPDRTINGPDGPVRVINGHIVPMDQQGL
jgi:hypothetical protein